MRCDNSSVEFGGFRDGLCSACATLVPTTLLGHIGDCMLLLPLCKCALLGREGYHACVVALVSTKPCLRTVEKQTSSGDAAERAQHERSDDTACLAPMCATLSLTHPCYVPVAMVPRRAASATDRHTTASDSHHKDATPNHTRLATHSVQLLAQTMVYVAWNFSTRSAGLEKGATRTHLAQRSVASLPRKCITLR